jgi:hypothetical protein
MLHLGKNLVSPMWAGPNPKDTFHGTVSGKENMVVLPDNDPGLVDLMGLDLHPKPGSIATTLGAMPPAGFDGQYAINAEYNFPASSKPRADGGATAGAFTP